MAYKMIHLLQGSPGTDPMTARDSGDPDANRSKLSSGIRKYSIQSHTSTIAYSLCKRIISLRDASII
jgi:hypothetical protein